MNRSTALQEEMQFWKDWFLTRGLQWPEDYRSRFDPQQPIHNHVGTFIDRLEPQTINILDVGAGPLTKLGKKHPSKQLVITATDLLACSYDRLLKELEIVPLVRTIYANGERLVEQFGENAFDIVHGENCIDHTIDPLQVMEQMIAVSKPEGYVVLYHEENEGQKQHYQQLHQWDFTCEGASFVIRDHRGHKINVSKKLASYCDVECIRDGDKIRTGIRKRVV